MSTAAPGPRAADRQITANPHNDVLVEVGEHYTGRPAVKLTFRSSPAAANTTVEVMTDPGELRQLGLELIQAANQLDF